MKKILVIEDQEICRELYCVMLKKKGYQVVEAANGEEAMALYDASFDLVITDIFMDHMDGFEVIEYLRRQNYPVKILAITGNLNIGNMETLSLACRYGADAVLSKPIDWKMMQDTITELIHAGACELQGGVWSNHQGLTAALQGFIEDSFQENTSLPDGESATQFLMEKGFPKKDAKGFVDVVYPQAADYFLGNVGK